MTLDTLYLSAMTCWHIDNVTQTSKKGCVLDVSSHQHSSVCPLCHVSSAKKQSKYKRKPMDLPIGPYSCRIRLSVHRFYCLNPACIRKIFCERFVDCLAAYQRFTQRAIDLIFSVGIEVGGNKGSRVLTSGHIPVSGSTVIRKILEHPLPDFSSQNIGIDDWAKRKGHNYGTIIVDNETHQVLGLLNGRASIFGSQWLNAHPYIQTITRDRGDCFIKAIRDALPNVTEIADRWHLIHNLHELSKQAFRRMYPAIKNELEACKIEMPQTVVSIPELTERKISKWEQKFILIKNLQKDGFTKTEIAKSTKINIATVSKYWKWTDFKETIRKKRSGIDDFDDYLQQRIKEDYHLTNSQLLNEIRTLGYTGCLATVAHYTHHLRPVVIPRIKPPDAKELYYLSRKDKSNLSELEKLYITRLEENAELREVISISKEFEDALKEKKEDGLEQWIKGAKDAIGKEMIQFTSGIMQDYKAVANAFSMEWHNGITEGFVNKLKMIKRMCYGRCALPLLERMMIFGNYKLPLT